jgi:hypothetical protein
MWFRNSTAIITRTRNGSQVLAWDYNVCLKKTSKSIKLTLSDDIVGIRSIPFEKRKGSPQFRTGVYDSSCFWRPTSLDLRVSWPSTHSLKFHCILVQEGSLYEGGIFFVNFRFGEKYPFSPPQVSFSTKIYHPNISSTTGRVSLDIFFDAWNPAITIDASRL